MNANLEKYLHSFITSELTDLKLYLICYLTWFALNPLRLKLLRLTRLFVQLIELGNCIDILGREIDAITKAFNSRGLKLRTGRWTALEKKKLHQNFEDFVKTHESIIGSPVDFVVTSDDKSRASEVIR